MKSTIYFKTLCSRRYSVEVDMNATYELLEKSIISQIIAEDSLISDTGELVSLDNYKDHTLSMKILFNGSNITPETNDDSIKFILDHARSESDPICIVLNNAKIKARTNQFLDDNSLDERAAVLSEDILFLNINQQCLLIEEPNNANDIITKWEHELSRLILETKKAYRNTRDPAAVISLALQKLLLEYDKQKVEIMILLDKSITNKDKECLISLNVKRCQEKNTNLLLLTKEMFDNFPDNIKLPGTKLSFIFSWCNNSDNVNAVNYAQSIAKIADCFTNLDLIVLRGCSTFQPFLPSENNQAHLHMNRKSVIIAGAKRDFDHLSIKINSTDFLFHQNGTATSIAYQNEMGNIVSCSIPNIPRNTGGNKLSIEVISALAKVRKEYNLPALNIEAHSMSLKEHLRVIAENWRNGEIISKDDKQLLQLQSPGFTSYQTNTPFTVNSLAGLTWLNLQSNSQVKLKAYSAAYGINRHIGTFNPVSHLPGSLPKSYIVKNS